MQNKDQKKIRLNIPASSHREDIVIALAASGYLVSEEIEEDVVHGNTHYVVFYLK